MTRAPADFGGNCLIGECDFTAELVLPSSTYLGLRKAGSYLYATVRDEDGDLLRMLRGVDGGQSGLRSLFVAETGGQLQRHPRSEQMYGGAVSIDADGDTVTFAATEPGQPAGFRFVQHPASCAWNDSGVLTLAGQKVAPAVQWFNTWDGGACLSATAKYRVCGTVLGRAVEGFVGHEIHYFTEGYNWLSAPYGTGREICWQQIANEYEDGSMIQATFAYGIDGWGFAMVHDENGDFLASTDVHAEASVTANGYPATICYRFAGQSWTWRIDPQGQRPSIDGIALRGADGTCVRDGDSRRVRLSMGNSDWWTDGRAEAILTGRQ